MEFGSIAATGLLLINESVDLAATGLGPAVYLGLEVRLSVRSVPLFLGFDVIRNLSHTKWVGHDTT